MTVTSPMLISADGAHPCGIESGDRYNLPAPLIVIYVGPSSPTTARPGAR